MERIPFRNEKKPYLLPDKTDYYGGFCEALKTSLILVAIGKSRQGYYTKSGLNTF
jgi:hypothetical protein